MLNFFVNIYATSYKLAVAGGFAFDAAASDSSVEIFVMESEFSSQSSKVANGSSMIQLVSWNPSEGLVNESGDVLSPATMLEHEIDHAYDEVKNPSLHNSGVDTKDRNFTNKEEKRVITGNETTTARANGEISKNRRFSRDSHKSTSNYGNTVIIDGGPSSTKVNKSKSAQYRKKLSSRPYETSDY